MIIMPGNNSSGIVHYLAGQHPGRIGWLQGPTNWKQPRFYLPFALDNDAFTAWTSKKPWDEHAWRAMLEKVRICGSKPLWALIPDVVANREATLRQWIKFAPVVAALKIPLAFAVQDGMDPEDVPQEADVVFVGGTTTWKWRTARMWADCFPRVHVGRVNELNRLIDCEKWGVESIDGTGWFRGTDKGRQARALLCWLQGIEYQNLELDLSGSE